MSAPQQSVLPEAKSPRVTPVGRALASYFARPQAAMPWPRIAAAAAAGAITIAVLGLLSDSTGFPLLVATFGSSCVLVFTLPDSPLSRPANVIGGHVAAALCGLLARFALPEAWWSLALGVGAALALMAALRVTHPPAGGTPIAIMLAHEGWGYILAPILLGAIIVAVCGSIYRSLSAAARKRVRRTRIASGEPR
ncbi:MAG: HPP family protein [Leucobacter sp.]